MDLSEYVETAPGFDGYSGRGLIELGLRLCGEMAEVASLGVDSDLVRPAWLAGEIARLLGLKLGSAGRTLDLNEQPAHAVIDGLIYSGLVAQEIGAAVAECGGQVTSDRVHAIHDHLAGIVGVLNAVAIARGSRLDDVLRVARAMKMTGTATRPS